MKRLVQSIVIIFMVWLAFVVGVRFGMLAGKNAERGYIKKNLIDRGILKYKISDNFDKDGTSTLVWSNNGNDFNGFDE